MISEDYDHRWEALAEVHFNAEDDFTDENFIYCLCSRVFIRDGVKLYMVEKEEGSESEIEVYRDSKIQELDDQSHVHFSVDTSYKVKCEKDEGASCYCSASHTDNYCSTDEHDTAQVHTSILNALQPSDSGADLTYQDSNLDYLGLGKPEKMEQDYPTQSMSGFEENYLSESTWEKFWSVNGERIIWASWIKQYSDYINPAYLDENNDLIMDENIPRDNSVDQISNIKSSAKKDDDNDGMRERKFSYDSKVNPYKKGRINSESSGEKTNKSSELLNNKDHAWLPVGGRRRSCSEHDRILSPRTLPCTDSMTNVTKITLSSYDVTSSHVTSVSTPTDEYSVSSSTSDDPSNDQTRIANLEENLETQMEEMDMDQSWQFLWKKHFGEQYALHYAYYLECQEVSNKNNYINTELTEILKDKIEIDYENSDGNSQEMPTVIEVQNRVDKIKLEEKARPKKRNKKSSTKYIGSVGVLLQNLLQEEKKTTDLEDVLEAGDESSDRKDTPPVDTVDGPSMDSTNVEPTVNYDNYYSGNYDDDEDNRPPEDRPVKLKRGHEIDAEEQASEKIKSIFEQMGLCLHPDAVLRGQLVYRKRLLRPPKPRTKKFGVPRKTYFDEDGNAVDQPQDSNEEKDMQTDDDCPEVRSDSETRQPHQSEPQKMLTESDTDKPSGVHDNSDFQPMATDAHDANKPGRHDNSDVTDNKLKVLGNDDGIPSQMYSGCATDVPVKPDGCPDERGAIDEAATVPLPPEVDSDGQGTDGLEKSGEEVLESVDTTPGEATKRRRRKRRRSPDNGHEMPAELQLHPNMKKYWKKRHSLFHRFDEGIRLDVESWFSVTPEKVAKHLAEKCRCDLIVDAFCGAGGNAIQFAWTCERVIAIDIDPAKIELARHNAAVYGVADRIEFVVGDFFALAPGLKADVVFLSPPWGGPKYVENSQYDLESMLEPKPASELMEAAQAISSNVAIYVPRNSRSEQLVSLAKYSGAVEIEQNFLGRRFIALTAYYGELVNY